MEATLEKSHLVTKTKAIETPPQLKIRSYHSKQSEFFKLNFR